MVRNAIASPMDQSQPGQNMSDHTTEAHGPGPKHSRVLPSSAAVREPSTDMHDRSGGAARAAGGEPK